MFKRLSIWLMMTMVTLALAACGGGGGSDSSSSGTTSTATASFSGIAVDPYLVGAVFEEIDATGTQNLQRASTPSDNEGKFIFPKALTAGSTVRLKLSQRGMHGTTSFKGMIKRVIPSGASGSVVVSPLTTLVANGASEEEVVQLFKDAGITLTRAQINTNPMTAIEGGGVVTDNQLAALQANMALNLAMESVEDFDLDVTGLNSADKFGVLLEMTDAVKALLNQAEFTAIAGQLATDSTLTQPLIIDDLIYAVVEQTQGLVQQAKDNLAANGGRLDRVEFSGQVQNALRETILICKSYIEQRQNSNPGPGTDPAPGVDGATVFANNCSSCHNLGNGGTMDLTGKGTKVTAKINGGHKGKVLTADELAALVAHVDGQGGGTTPPPTPDPGPAPDPTPVDGQTVFNNNCLGCHNLGNGGLMDLSGKGTTVATKINNGHQNKSLSADELAALIALVDAQGGGTTPPPTPDPGTPPNGTALYGSECAGCHGALANTDIPGRTSTQIQAAIDNDLGGMSALSTLTAEEVQAIADTLPALPDPGPGPGPGPAPDGQTVYDNNCSSCHKMGTYDTAGNPELGGKGNLIPGKINAGHMGVSLSAAELDAVALFSDANPPVTTPPPTPTPDGQTLYDNNCASCHKMGGYDTAGNPELGGKGSLIPGKIQSGHMGFNLTVAEQNALAAFSDANPPAPTPPPVPAPDGQTVYDNNCSSCHKMGTYDTVGNPELGGKGNLIPGKINAGHMGVTLSAAELEAVAIFSDANPPATTPPPTPTPVGVDVYNNNCAVCHSVNGYDATGAPDLAAKGNLISGKLAAGHNGQSLTAGEENVLSAFLDQYQAPATGPDYSDCTACHAQPPNGNSAPNTEGAHAVHAALPGVGNNCNICHTGADHNGQVDLGFPAAYNAKSGTATDNMDGTCSNISCHGGQKTPDWWTGNISVNSDCASCHTRGTSQYNSQNSGEHSKHRNRSCTECHNTGKMTNHFGNLATPSLETDPASTIGGGSTRVGSYNGSSCSSIQCHGGESW